MSVDISVSITEDIVDIIATPTVNIVNVTNSASIDPSLYDLSEFTNTSPNPFVRTSGLSSYVPTSRTLTINGTTQDLSANRTFTVSTGITIGTTAITSGTVGRVLFEGTGNVVQESANLFWDNTNGRLGIGTSSPARALDILSSGDVLTGLKTSSATGVSSHVVLNDINSSSEFGVWGSTRSTFGAIGSNNAYIYSSVDFAITSLTNIKFGTGASLAERMRIVSGNGNVLINTTTDAGFKLDVNGALRASFGQLWVGGGHYLTGTAVSGTDASMVFRRTADNGWVRYALGTTGGVSLGANFNSGEVQLSLPFGGFFQTFYSNGSERMRIATTGNVLINTTTDDGYKLDVNGTARVNGSSFFATTSGTLAVGTTTIVNMNYGEVPKTYLTGGTFINGTLQLPTTLRVIATGGGIQFAQQSQPSPNSNLFFGNDSTGVYYGNYGTLGVRFLVGNTAQMTLASTTGNVLINTTTDAGYRLDVNGTARVSGQLEVNSVNSTQGILLKHFALATTATQIYYNSPDAVTYFDTLFNYNASSALGSYNFRTKNSSNALTSRLFIQGWDGSIGIGTTTPVGKTDIVTGFADASSLNQAETFRLRSTAVDGNTSVMNFGISHTGVGGANQGYGYIQFGYSGGSVDNPLVLQPLGGGVSVGAAVATSDYKLQVLQESSIKAAANSGGGALGGRLSFPFAGSYSGKVAYIAQVQDTTNWFNSAGLVFATVNGSDISASTGVERMRIGGNGNVLINTTTDAGFRLDVNGTARVTSVTAGVALVSTWSISASYARFGHNLFNGGTTFGFLQQQTGDCFINGLSNFFAATNNNIFETNGAERMRITSTGNVLIGTTTNGASKLRLVGLPTSAAGLSAGDIWNDAGTLKIV